MNKFVQFFKTAVMKQSMGSDLHTIILLALGFIVAPAIVSFVVYFISKLVHIQMGSTVGDHTQAIASNLGAFIHELEMMCIAVLGGHSLRNTKMQSAEAISKFHAAPALDHPWISHTVYQSVWDFLLGTVPVYLTAMLIWGIQCLLGGNTFSTAVAESESASTIFFRSLGTAFSTGHIIEKPLLFIAIILIASAGFDLTHDEVSRIFSGVFAWAVTLLLVFVVALLSAHVFILTTASRVVMGFSAFILAHVVIYLAGILIILLILKGLDVVISHK